MSQELPRARAHNLFQKVRLQRPAKLIGQGFTLIELLIVTAISMILLIIVLARFGAFGGQVDLNTASQRILSTLQRARNQTLASENETVYGVHFEAARYVLFQGATYDPLDTDNVDYDLDTTEIYSINLAGGTGRDVVFDRVRGTTANNGSVSVRLLADNSKTQTILVSLQGQVSLQETVTPTGTRVSDTRHIHLVFGWSMQSSTTMRLIFSVPGNPDVIENIPIQNYIGGGKFDWEGEVGVSGDDQELKIHSHVLDASNTTLSVHRDRRKNDKALEIQIDGTTIVTYDAAGVATPGFINQLIIQ